MPRLAAEVVAVKACGINGLLPAAFVGGPLPFIPRFALTAPPSAARRPYNLSLENFWGEGLPINMPEDPEKLTYSDFALHRSQDFWTLLLFSGYLTVVECLAVNTYRVRIPNEEIRNTFINNVKERYSQANREFVTYGQDFAKAALSGDTDGMSDILVPLLENYVSVRDTAVKAPAENYYHGFLTALLLSAGSYVKELRSNVEAGDGYADLVFTSGTGSRRIGVIIEVKRSANPEDMYDAADKALTQIKEKRYTALLDRLRCGKQYIYGIAFCRKDCAVTGGSVDAVK